jgi:hypothetical protein
MYKMRKMCKLPAKSALGRRGGAPLALALAPDHEDDGGHGEADDEADEADDDHERPAPRALRSAGDARNAPALHPGDPGGGAHGGTGTLLNTCCGSNAFQTLAAEGRGGTRSEGRRACARRPRRGQ